MRAVGFGPATLDDGPRSAPLFYGTFALVTVTGAGVVLIRNVPLVAILVLTQVRNPVLLPPLHSVAHPTIGRPVRGITQIFREIRWSSS